MYKIGDFSKITNLTVKALRYYDEENLLKPSFRDSENGYRYYDKGDFKRARVIVLLRELDFSISEIKDVLENCEETEDLSYYLSQKKSMIEEKIKKEKDLVCKISLYIKSEKMEEKSMDYKIEVKEFEQVLTASIRYKGKYDDVGKYYGKIYKAIKGKSSGAPFNLYYDEGYKEDNADIEICIPISKSVSAEGITVKKLPAIKAICTTHIGSYENLNFAYKALLDYAAENNLKLKIPSRECYIKGPGMIFKGNPNKYVTEIIIPVE